VSVFAISRDSPYSHVAWREVLELNFPLLSDWNGEAIAGFDVQLADYHGMRGVADRTAFLLDDGGSVRGAWHYETGEVPDLDQLLVAARALS
jgi:glutaredoxin-dependent peroxiredoxin